MVNLLNSYQPYYGQLGFGQPLSNIFFFNLNFLHKITEGTESFLAIPSMLHFDTI